ncbi:MAG: helix-turn-helix transcriptional regulator [Longimicrobiales bacterium]
MELSEDRRNEIASYVRRRRARLRPADVGLPDGRRRRTPGLRREEVAALAGVSTEWYKWIEQARAVRASEETLRRIAGALRLEPGEVRHLLTLAGYGVTDHDRAPGHAMVVGDHIRRLLDQLDPCPAWVYGERWDILAWNRGATIIYGDLDAMPERERNIVYQLFLGARMRSMLIGWKRHASGMVGKLRTAHARYLDDAWFNELIGTLVSRSPEFATLWADHVVGPYQDGVKHYDHPDAGKLSFEYTVLSVTDERFATLSLVMYVPLSGTGTRCRLEELLAPAVTAG